MVVIVLSKRDADVYATLVRNRNGPLTYAEIAEVTGHANMTVKRAIDELVSQGIIAAEYASGQGQRTPLKHGSIEILMEPTEVLLRMMVDDARAIILELLQHEQRRLEASPATPERLLETS